jgi:hypothetical protein
LNNNLPIVYHKTAYEACVDFCDHLEFPLPEFVQFGIADDPIQMCVFIILAFLIDDDQIAGDKLPFVAQRLRAYRMGNISALSILLDPWFYFLEYHPTFPVAKLPDDLNYYDMSRLLGMRISSFVYKEERCTCLFCEVHHEEGDELFNVTRLDDVEYIKPFTLLSSSIKYFEIPDVFYREDIDVFDVTIDMVRATVAYVDMTLLSESDVHVEDDVIFQIEDGVVLSDESDVSLFEQNSNDCDSDVISVGDSDETHFILNDDASGLETWNESLGYDGPSTDLHVDVVELQAISCFSDSGFVPEMDELAGVYDDMLDITGNSPIT